MKRKVIIFPAINSTELIEEDCPELTANKVLVRTAFSTISPGTERANIIGDASVAGNKAPSVKFPRRCGYSSSGIVEAVGEAVTSVKPGDSVVAFQGIHTNYNCLGEKNVLKIEENVTMPEAALAFIGTFPMAALRKTNIEIGESCLVMGLGLLGQFAVRFARLCGAVPVIAVDPVAERREMALAAGADYAFDPFDPNFAESVKAVSRGGVHVAIEVTGMGAGLDGALDCMRKYGRVALLGCTRDKNFTIDYYRKVHYPGISLIGAHTNARPKEESSHGLYTHADDIRTILQLLNGKRLDLSDMTGHYYAPQECAEVFDRLIHDRNFPMAVQFDWSKL